MKTAVTNECRERATMTWSQRWTGYGLMTTESSINMHIHYPTGH